MILTKLLKIEQLMHFKEYHDSVEFMNEEMGEIRRAKEVSGFRCYEELMGRVDRVELINRV